MMKEVDARGLSCPEPVMLTEEALKAEMNLCACSLPSRIRE